MPATGGPGSLRGLRVLDLSRVLAGPYCGQMLADHGADVIKVEAPRGDETREWGPPFLADGMSAYYRNLNRNKRNVVVDLSRPEGRAVVDDLLGRADVLVENFKAGTLEKWGWDRDTLERRHPRLVHCRITGFGTDGPLGGLPGYDAVLQAYGGLMSVNGEPAGGPLRVGVPVVDLVTGVLAFSGILLALRERETSGRGQLIDMTLLDTVISLLHPHSGAWLADGTPGRRTGNAHPSIAPYEAYPTPEGPIFIGAGNDRQFAILAAVLAAPELVADPRFATNRARLAHVEDLRMALRPLIARRPRDVLARELLARGVPASPVNTVAEALTSDQVRHRDMVVERADYAGPGIPIRLGRTPGAIGPAPRAAGEDTVAVLTDLGYSEEDIERLTAQRLVDTPEGSCATTTS
jgi:crotonobetainyl-CoA:carnitine CoA-transferase CaiB-like acyl-CoA transferase